MERISAILLAAALPLAGFSQVASKLAQQPDPAKELRTVEATCGECQFGMEGDACDLAVRVGDGTYFVDGVGIGDYGNPHGKDGFCVAVRRAEVQGEVVDGRFKATYFKLLDAKEGKDGHQHHRH